MTVRSLFGWGMGHARGKPGRYVMVSGVAVVVTQATLVTANVVVGLSAVWSNVVAVSVGCIPSYLLNRYWVWGKRSRNRFLSEVLPFWAMAIIGLALSTLLVVLADRAWDHVLALMAANLSGFGLLWVVKYLVLDAVLFGATEEGLDAPGPVEGAGEPDRARI